MTNALFTYQRIILFQLLCLFPKPKHVISTINLEIFCKKILSFPVTLCRLNHVVNKQKLTFFDQVEIDGLIFNKMITVLYYMAYVCSRYNARSDWPVVGHYSPVKCPQANYGLPKPNEKAT